MADYNGLDIQSSAVGLLVEGSSIFLDFLDLDTQSAAVSQLTEGTYKINDFQNEFVIPPRKFILNRASYSGSPAFVYWLSPDLPDPTGIYYTGSIAWSSLTDVICASVVYPCSW